MNPLDNINVVSVIIDGDQDELQKLAEEASEFVWG